MPALLIVLSLSLSLSVADEPSSFEPLIPKTFILNLSSERLFCKSDLAPLNPINKFRMHRLRGDSSVT